MKRVLKDFCIRGMAFAWGGPVVLAIVWMCLQSAGVIEILTIRQAVLGILSTSVMAFIAAGISVVYRMEQLPKGVAGLIQAAVLYADYLGIYLLNGWLAKGSIAAFTLIFALGFVAIRFAIYLPIKIKVAKMNKLLGKQ